MGFNPEEVNRLIRSRRSVYPTAYKGGEISEEVFQEIMENANWAPNHRHTEPWRFMVMKGESKKEFFDFVIARYKRVTPPEAFKEVKVKKLMMFREQVSHVVAVVMERDQEERIPEKEEEWAVACAVQNIYLSCTAYGVGGYWSTGMGTFSDDMREHLKLRSDQRLMGFFLMGEADEVAYAGQRQPVSEKLTWI